MRDNINVNSSIKLFESYRDFSGGLNTQMSNELMKDNQSTIAENVELTLTHSIKKRSGKTGINTSFFADPIQGLFNFINNSETLLICAAGGLLYYARPNITGEYGAWVNIPMTNNGSSFSFQIVDYVEAVQYENWLYIATGTKLVRCQVYQDSLGVTQASATTIVDQFKPTSQEAVYVGLNSLNTTPSAYLVDNNAGTAGAITALGIYSSNILLRINYNHQFTAYRTAPYVNGCDYQWSYKKTGDTTWIPFTGVYGSWITGGNKTAQFNIPEAGTYDIQVEMRLSSSHAVDDTYELYGLKVNPIIEQTTLPSTNIQSCRRILLHWDRLILYDPKIDSTVGTTNERDCIYISQVGEPTYFPSLNVISFGADTQQRVKKIVRYRNILMIFTQDTIQSLAGKSPSDYVRSLINSQVGTIWGGSVQVVENDVYFISKQGIYAVRPNVYQLDNFNIASLDDQIRDDFSMMFIPSDGTVNVGSAVAQVVSAVHNNQYWLYSTQGYIYRYYFNRKSWVRDTMPSHFGSVSYASPIVSSFKNDQVLLEPYFSSTQSGVVGLDSSVYTDDVSPYTMTLRTKFFDLSYAFNYKKLRKLYILARLQGTDINLGVRIEADTSVVLDPDVGSVVIDPLTSNVTWQINSVPNFHFEAGSAPQNALQTSEDIPAIIGNWISGMTPLGDSLLGVLKTTIRAKCRRVRITFTHSEGSICEIYGFGLEFRAKRP